MTLDAMRNQSKLLYVAERDIDLLLLEELNVSHEFSKWLFQRVFGDIAAVPNCEGAWHSVTHPQLGESDLVVIYEDGSAILVENKVDAPAQPEQAARYRRRGEGGFKEGHWERFVTCIFAPERYLKGNIESHNYDVRVSYEEIRDWLKGQGSRRYSYRSYVFDEAIEQNRRGYSPVADEDVTSFWRSYWELATKKFPSLEMTRPGIKPANSDWPDFRPNILGKELNIVHKMAQGYVDLQVRGASDKLDEIRSFIVDPDLDVVAAGKSAAIRLVVTQVDRFGSFEAQRTSILRALDAAHRLLTIGKELRNGI
ncbi:PD-(D/E)XK nuclease superfamily protein [Marinobacter nauticus]|uniref:PD-(D/E)XK nuclease family protein n=1 Tax=Marinobacter nauticus TaxID=2743 RepID=UPI00112FA0B5|nr:PD-(D/E)XK nuclease family protein [Marinobacter nauticus]TPW22680.1 PD-(D/E)XK nuclease superfamily protein [Marinobacter nauticus]